MEVNSLKFLYLFWTKISFLIINALYIYNKIYKYNKRYIHNLYNKYMYNLYITKVRFSSALVIFFIELSVWFWEIQLLNKSEVIILTSKFLHDSCDIKYKPQS